jgi:hypothetical protein
MDVSIRFMRATTIGSPYSRLLLCPIYDGVCWRFPSGPFDIFFWPDAKADQSALVEFCAPKLRTLSQLANQTTPQKQSRTAARLQNTTKHRFDLSDHFPGSRSA